MKRTCTLLTAVLLAGAVMPSGATPAFADPSSQTPAQQLAQLNQQLDADQAKLNELNNQVENAQAEVDRLNRLVTDDAQRETVLGARLGSLARLEYEQPAFSLMNLLEARSLDQLLANLAQARLVVRKQGNLLTEAQRLRRQDERARSQMDSELSTVQTARDQAAKVAAQTLALRNTVLDAAIRARAAALNAQAQATTTVALRAPTGPWPNHFAFGYCTWYVATKRFIPWYGNAIEWWANAQAYGYPESQSPKVGSIMVTRESYFGHVAYVEALNSDGSWVVSEMNYTGWDVVDRRTVKFGTTPVVGFINGQ